MCIRDRAHTRDVKEWIKEGRVSGWDDIRLHTVRALLRRGFQPEAFRQYAIHCALTKHDIVLDWETLETINRKIIDPVANRCMVVIDPVRVSVEPAPKSRKIEMNIHPDFPDRGKRTIPIRPEKIYISGEDFDNLCGKEIRLKGFGNIVLGRKSLFTGNEIIKDMQKIQWVSLPNVRVRILMPERELKGLGEPAMRRLKKGDVVQLERIGFGRVDKKTKSSVTVCFAHK